MILVVCGPTGVGKTKMSVELAKVFNGEVINADAMQVYKGLDIGTAKITENEKDGINHRLFDICDVEDDYSVYDYQNDCRFMIGSIYDDSKVPVMVGGTGLYIKAALFDYKFNEMEIKSYDELSNEELLDKIMEYNIEINFDVKNRRRLVMVLNKLENDLYNIEDNNHILYDDVIVIGLTTGRELLYEKINHRVDVMIENGLLDEVKSFYDKGIRSKAIMTGIGYKELYSYFDKEISLEEAIELIKQRSRRYAKRQYTFFNNQLDINWFNVDYDNFNNTVLDVVKFIKDKKSQ